MKCLKCRGGTFLLSGLFVPVRQKPGAETAVWSVKAWDVMKTSPEQRRLPVPVLRPAQAAAVAAVGSDCQGERWMPARGLKTPQELPGPAGGASGDKIDACVQKQKVS